MNQVSTLCQVFSCKILTDLIFTNNLSRQILSTHFLQMRKLRLKAVMLFAQDYRAVNWKRWDSGTRRETEQEKAGGPGPEWLATSLGQQQ